MLPIQFEQNSQYMRYEYHRVREGPNYFVSYYQNSSRLHYDPKNCWRTLGVAKFTNTGKALKEWCLSMNEQYGVKKLPEDGRKDTSFASEALSDADTEEPELETIRTNFKEAIDSISEEPNDNTKMVT